MACSFVRAVTVLWTWLFLIALVTGSKETPREDADQEDKWFFHFMTRPDIQAPKFEVHIHDADAVAPGYWFVAPYHDINKRYQGYPWEGPYIYDGDGELIWAGPPDLNYYNAHDFKVSNLNGEDHLTTIYPLNNAGLFWNNRYEIVKTVTWTPSWESANMHEFHIIANGTRALTTTRDGHRELSLEESKTIGFDGRCMVRADGIEELDISTDPPKLLFKWIGIEHIPLSHTAPHMKQEKVNEMCDGNWDIHHINSVDKFENGDYLVSFKVLSTIFRVSHRDGSIVWRLGGPHSDFSVPHNVRFESQHIPRIVSESSSEIKLSIFDNAGGKLARGILVDLDLRRMAATLVQAAPHPYEITMGSRGSTQLLDNGNLFSCWAEWSRITEHDANGKQVLFAHVKPKGENKMPTYRGYKFQWVGQPSDPPNVYSAAFALGLDRKRIMTHTFVSWNGATEVGEYKLFESNADETQWNLLNKTEKTGFETNIQYGGFAEYVLVEAIGRDGRSLGWSRLVHTVPPVQGITDEQKAVDWSKGPADFPVSEPCKPPDLGGTTPADVRVSPIAETLTNPVATYIAGIFTAAGLFWGLRVAKWTWRRRIGTKYRPLDAKGYAHLLREDDDDKYTDTELDDRKSSSS